MLRIIEYAEVWGTSVEFIEYYRGKIKVDKEDRFDVLITQIFAFWNLYIKLANTLIL